MTFTQRARESRRDRDPVARPAHSRSVICSSSIGRCRRCNRDISSLISPRFPIWILPGSGLLVNFYVAAQKHGRKMAIVGATQRIVTLFELTKVDSLLKLYPTVEAAEAAS